MNLAVTIKSYKELATQNTWMILVVLFVLFIYKTGLGFASRIL